MTEGDPVTAKAMPHPLRALLGRYRSVLALSWAHRRELAGPARLAHEAAFLPAALSLQESPAHPAPRRAMVVIVTLFIAALAWSVLGRVDIVAVAQGRIVVSDRTKVVQSLENAVVRAIHVADGQKVRAGEVLLELDPTSASADRASVAEQLRAAESDVARTRALLAALRSGTAPALPRAAPDVSALLASEWHDLRARLSRLLAERTRREAELRTATELLAKLEATLPLARKREADVKALADDGYAPAHAGQDRARERLELERDIATQQSRIQEARAALAESVQSSAALEAEAARQWSDREAQATVRAAQLRQEGSKTAQRERLTRLLAPVSGTVQQLAVHTLGGVVTGAQTLLVVVPDAAEVTADVTLDNKDIGFVRAGQAAVVKLDTFNFTRYGTVPAQVLRVTADAVVDEKRGAVFPATLRLQTGHIDIDGKRVRLAPGMTLTAEVHTGRRRVIEYLLGPVTATLNESLRER